MKINELRLRWLTALRLKTTPFIKSNNDFLYFFGIILLTISNFFSKPALTLYQILAILVSISVYYSVTRHKMVMAILLPAWGQIFIYQLFLQTLKGLLKIDDVFLTIIIISLPYIALWKLNKSKPHLAFVNKSIVFTIIALVMLYIRWIGRTWSIGVIIGLMFYVVLGVAFYFLVTKLFSKFKKSDIKN